MALTGDRDGPPLAPATTAATVAHRALARFGLDETVLAERAAHLGLTRQGDRSCGGATRLLEAAEGWLALALPRPEDVGSLPALLGIEPVGDPWPEVEAAVRSRPAAEVAETAALLGMAASVVGESTAAIGATGEGRPEAPGWRVPPLVLDLSSLWAGPLCGHLLGRAGARVVKVEASGRPDGARAGVASFFDLLNHGKASAALDLASEEGRQQLGILVQAADVVVTSSRARAVEQLGLDPAEFLAGGSDRVWVAVTGHGWDSTRVGFGDDAAAAAGLVAWGADGRPRFAADAVADPLCGALAAERAHDAWTAGGRWFLDVSLAGAAAAAMATTGSRAPTTATAAALDDGGAWSLAEVPVAEPVARRAGGVAARLGADTARILAEVGR